MESNAYRGRRGAVTGGVQRMTLASDDPAVALLTTIDTDTGAMVTDLAAIEVLLGTIDADTGAMVVDLAAIEALLTTIDTDTGAMVTDLAAIEALITAGNVDLAAIEVLITAGNVDLAAMEALLITIDADTGAIKTAVELIDNAISGSEMLIAGGATQTNDIKVTLDSEAVVLGASDGTDIGDVDVASIAAGTATIGGAISYSDEQFCLRRHDKLHDQAIRCGDSGRQRNGGGSGRKEVSRSRNCSVCHFGDCDQRPCGNDNRHGRTWRQRNRFHSTDADGDNTGGFVLRTTKVVGLRRGRPMKLSI